MELVKFKKIEISDAEYGEFMNLFLQNRDFLKELPYGFFPKRLPGTQHTIQSGC